jgi:acetolactate synthase-1/2/3 large subunit
VSAITTAHFNGSAVVVLGGRAPDYRWGSGSLQEIDHPLLLGAVTKRAWTEHQAANVGAAVDEAFRLAATPHRGPVFLDIALEALFGQVASPAVELGRRAGHTGGPAAAAPGPASPGGSGNPAGPGGPGSPRDPGSLAGSGGGPSQAANSAPAAGEVTEIARLVAAASRPVLVIGSDVWIGAAEAAAREAAEVLRLPVVANGQARGVLPAGHELLVTRARSLAFGQADLVVVVGTPLDFRLGYGEFGGRNGAPPAQVVHVADAPGQLATHRRLAASAAGDLTAFFTALASEVPAAVPAGPGGADGGRLPWERSWLPRLQAATGAAVAADHALLTSDADPIHPMRVYGELGKVLESDAVVIGDGGDFVSYAGKYLEPQRPGCWLDPGPYGCLGTGPGYAIGARIARPSAQVVLLLGDGAAGFSLMDADTLVRHGLPVVMVCGNNGIWGLEKHPMQALYGYDVAADLQQGCRYDEVVRALGGAGELVTSPSGVAPALRRAFDAGAPYLVNVVTDPKVAYPRSTTGI